MNFGFAKIFGLLLLGDFQIAAQKEFRAIDDRVGAENISSFRWQFSQRVNGGPQAILERGEALGHLRRGRLGANDSIQVDFARSSLDLLRNRSLIDVVAQRRRNREHGYWFHAHPPIRLIIAPSEFPQDFAGAVGVEHG